VNVPIASDDPFRELRTLVAAGRFREAVEHYRAANDPRWRQHPEAQLLAATGATRIGDFRLAAPLAEAAENGFRTQADRDGRMRTTNLLGALAWEQGHLSDAEERFGEALNLARDLNDTLMAARASNNLASLAQLNDRADAALSLYRSALVSYQRLGDRRGLIETYHNLSLVFRHAGRWQDAEEATAQALRLAETLDDPALIAPVLTGLAELRLVTERVELARQDALRASELARRAGDALVGAEAGRILALIYLAMGQLDEALRAASAARQVASRHQSTLLEAEAGAAEARVLRALGRSEAAEERRVEARRLFTQLNATKWLQEFDAVWEVN
jgi:tetratricopeptide (TPR) repeat protein